MKFILLTLFIFGFGSLSAQSKKRLTTEEYNKKAEARMKSFRYPKGMKVELWADSSQTQNPSAMSFDSKGRLLVAEIHRWHFGVDDIRSRQHMLYEDLMIQSSADRLKMFKNHESKHPMSWYTAKSDSIKILEDTNGDGRADSAKVYATGFNAPLDGPGIGVIERDGKVYYTNIPHLWVMEDTDGDDVADKRQSLQDGFGIRMSLSGHDMHGLVWGPDGKLYWSIGDRGFSFTTKEGKKFHGPNEGAVFRCNADGSDIELFYERLRNPQELQFDDYGNLFTADNDGDRGDMERINYLVEGGDSGWTAGHQSLMIFTRQFNFRSYKYGGKKGLYNPWNTDLMWKVRSEQQPAFLLPGIGQIEGGPSGFLYNPSTSMGPEYNKKFFVIHYKGSLAKSNISMFNTEEEGAGFKTTNHKFFMKGSNCVDIEFGPDGRMYMSDYNYGGWENQNVGNIYAFSFPNEIIKPEILKNKEYMVADYSKFSVAELTVLLGRNHQMIRQKSQFELAKRGEEGKAVFVKAMSEKSNPTLVRIHGVWGLGQMAYKNPEIVKEVMSFLNDDNEQVRIQSARVLGDHRVKEAIPMLLKSLEDKHPRVAMYAGIALGRMKYDATEQVMAVIRKNNSKDLFLQHGMLMTLRALEKSKYMKYAKDESAVVRMAVLLSLRSHEDLDITQFLNDPDEGVRFEAIRAINDKPILAATSALAAELDKYLGKDSVVPKDGVAKFMHHRIINANFNNGTVVDAARLLKYAANSVIPERQRIEALVAIEAWNDGHPVDTTTGKPRKLAADRADIKATVLAGLERIFDNAKGKDLANATRIAALYEYKLKPAILMAQVQNVNMDTSVRKEAMRTLLKQKAGGLTELASSLLTDEMPEIRSLALTSLFSLDVPIAVKAAEAFLVKGSMEDKQQAYTLLGTQKSEEVKVILLTEMQRIINGGGELETLFEVLEASRGSEIPEVKALATTYDKSMLTAEPMVKYKSSLMGGNVARGKDTYLNNGVAQCVRCHKIKDFGADVGPNLSFIGENKSREYLLQSIVDPGAVVAPGFDMVTLELKDGKSLSGTLIKETAASVFIKSADGKTTIEYKRSEIQKLTPPISGMPPMALLLKPNEIRDIVAYLSTLKKWRRGRRNNDSH